MSKWADSWEVFSVSNVNLPYFLSALSSDVQPGWSFSWCLCCWRRCWCPSERGVSRSVAQTVRRAPIRNVDAPPSKCVPAVWLRRAAEAAGSPWRASTFRKTSFGADVLGADRDGLNLNGSFTSPVNLWLWRVIRLLSGIREPARRQCGFPLLGYFAGC